MRRSIAVVSLLLLASCGPGTRPAPRPEPTAPAGGGAEVTQVAEETPLRLPATVAPTRYTLTMAIAPAQDRFTGVGDIDVRMTERRETIWIHGQNLTVTEVVATESGRDPIRGHWEQVDAEHGIARLVLDRPVGPGPVRLHLAWSAPFDEQLEGLYRVRVGEDRYAFTQFEPLSARKAFPSFDEPRFKTPYDVTIVAPADLRAVASSREVESTDLPGGLRSVRFATTEPLPTYLVAWAVGPLDVVEGSIPPNAVRTTPLPFRGIAPRGRGPELAYAMEHTPRLVAALEEWFGIAYPFDKLDIVAVPDFSAGAMENAGLITFRDVLLLLRADAPVSQRRGFAFVMAHELAHQWFGNLVTMEWWDDLWLNEAFATWAETHTVMRVFPEMHADVTETMTALEAFDADALASARRIRNPIESTHDIHNAFDSITYSKGASVLNMVVHWLGEDVFQRGIQRYLREHAGGNATGEDLMGALAAESQQDVAATMSSFLGQPGVPLVAVSVQCGDGGASASLAQSRYLPVGSRATAQQTWRVPVCLRYRAGGEVRTTCTVMTEAEASVPLEGGACPDWVMPNAEANGYYRWTLDETALGRLRTRTALDALSVRERISVADSVRAGFAAGTVTFASAVQALEPFANSTDRFVATAPIELLEFAHDHLLEGEADEAAFRAYAARLYRDQLRRLGWGPRRGAAEEDGEVRLLRAAILSFLALTAEDPAVRREAQARGRAYVGEGARTRPGEIHPEAVPSDLVDVSLIVAAQEGGAPFFDTLDRLFGASQDAVVRNHLLVAMSSVDDPELRPRALALALDPRLRVNEIFRPIMGQMRDPEGRDAGWTWVQQSYDALVARMGPGYAGYLPFVASGFCSADRAAEVRAFFAPRVASTQGGPRNLESAVESIELCAARAAAHRESARSFFVQPARR